MSLTRTEDERLDRAAFSLAAQQGYLASCEGSTKFSWETYHACGSLALQDMLGTDNRPKHFILDRVWAPFMEDKFRKAQASTELLPWVRPDVIPRVERFIEMGMHDTAKTMLDDALAEARAVRNAERDKKARSEAAAAEREAHAAKQDSKREARRLATQAALASINSAPAASATSADAAALPPALPAAQLAPLRKREDDDLLAMQAGARGKARGGKRA